jgi:hypothetical protein
MQLAGCLERNRSKGSTYELLRVELDNPVRAVLPREVSKERLRHQNNYH